MGKTHICVVILSVIFLLPAQAQINKNDHKKKLTFPVPVRPQIVTYCGTITGYNSNMPFSSGSVIENNVVTGVITTHLVTIQPGGAFTATFPLLRNQQCWVSFPFFNGPVYFESGKKIVHNFNINNPAEVISSFAGAGAAINEGITRLLPVMLHNNWNTISSDTSRLTPEECNRYFLQKRKEKLAIIDSIGKIGKLSKAACEMVYRNITIDIACGLMEIIRKQAADTARYASPTFSAKQASISSGKKDYNCYRFLKNLTYNDSSALILYNYYQLINKLMFLPPVYDEAKAASDSFFFRQISMLKQKDTSDINIKNTIKSFEDFLRPNVTRTGELEKKRPAILKKLVGRNITLELDLMQTQLVCSQMNRNEDTLSAEQLSILQTGVENRFLLADVFILNNKIMQELKQVDPQAAGSAAAGDKPMPGDSLFNSILNKYPGKILFIDFWATWCSPCMAGIQKIEPLKEELSQNGGVVFIYITNTSSPQKKYETTIPGIKGEHYRISDDQFDRLKERFNINGIPHYIVVDKQGKIAVNDFRWYDINDIKAQLSKL